MITNLIADIVADKGIKIARISEATGIPYQKLCVSLDKTKSRELRADELVKVCKFLDINPLEL